MYFCPPVQNMQIWKTTVNVKETEKILDLCKEQRWLHQDFYHFLCSRGCKWRKSSLGWLFGNKKKFIIESKKAHGPGREIMVLRIFKISEKILQNIYEHTNLHVWWWYQFKLNVRVKWGLVWSADHISNIRFKKEDLPTLGILEKWEMFLSKHQNKYVRSWTEKITCVQSALACPATRWIDSPCALKWQWFWCCIRAILQQEREGERSNNCCDALCCQEWNWVNCASLGASLSQETKILLWGVQTQWVRELESYGSAKY